MSIKLKIINQAIKECKTKLVKVNRLLDATPLVRICEIRLEALDILEKYKGDHERLARLMKPLAREEKKMFSLYDKCQNTLKLSDEQCALSLELAELNSEKYFTEEKINRYKNI